MLRTLLITLALGVVASLAAALLAVAPASAHARWKSSTPGKGEALTASPARVEVEFTQEIQKISGGYGIQVVKDRGLDVTAGAAVVDNADRHKLSVPLQPNLAAGRYVVNWSNTSDEDGDPAAGAFSFYLNYQPNTVDLANDAQLALVGQEIETPASGGTQAATAVTTARPTAPASSTAAVTATTGTRTTTTEATPAAASADDGASNTTLIVIIVVAAGAGIGLGFGAWQFTRGRG